MNAIAAVYLAQIFALLIGIVAQFRVRRQMYPAWSWLTICAVMCGLLIFDVESILNLYEVGLMPPVVESGLLAGLTAVLLYRTLVAYRYSRQREMFIKQLETDFEEYRRTWPDRHSTPPPN